MSRARQGLRRGSARRRLANGSYVCGWSRASLAYPHGRTLVVCTRYCSTLPRLTSHFSRTSRDLIISVISGAPCRDKGNCLQPVWVSVYHSREMTVYTPFAVNLEIHLHSFCPRDHIVILAILIIVFCGFKLSKSVL
jgi:hypothetical protein